jgi:hypothetical protein
MIAFLRWLLPPWEYVQCKAKLETLRGKVWAYCVRRRGHPGRCCTNDGKRFRASAGHRTTK